MVQQERIARLPDSSGVYIFKDKKNEIIYIGKAKSILKRVRSHFYSKNINSKGEKLISRVRDIDFIITASEAEALLLESYLIKKEKPFYNISLRDDKSYPYLKITLKDDFPRILITRNKNKDGSLYLGPYPDAKGLKMTLKTLREIISFRSCRKFNKNGCLYLHIGFCPGPCLEKISKTEYRRNILIAVKTLLGDREGVIKDLTEEMDGYVKKREYEKAAKSRDRLRFLGNSSGIFGLSGGINVLENIKSILNLPKVPRIIDAVDISNVSGTSAAGAVIRFKDGVKDRELYRKFRLKKQNFIDDYEMMAEVVLRRYRDLFKKKEDLPDLIMLDGGKGHLNRIGAIIDKDFEIDIPLIAYAKGRDLIHSRYRKIPIALPQNSLEKNLLIRIRDEAHRFAIGYHRSLRGKRMKETAFENIPGVGISKVNAVLRYLSDLGCYENISVSDLKRIKGIGDMLAERMYDYVKKRGA
ncbi:MAG: excinuclease ABC subunit UvrC [Candidatus Kaelpia aquatica]|nr:excinuclease ABC subunit UvrC [Candidatus Kaelpia aquatica]